jgi:hypothetical protein
MEMVQYRCHCEKQASWKDWKMMTDWNHFGLQPPSPSPQQ